MGIETKAAYQVIRYENGLPHQYRHLVIAKWGRSFRHGNDYAKLIDADSYFQNYPRYIQAILTLPQTTVRLATLIDDTDVVLGFSIVSDTTLHYVYVNRGVRRQGIGKTLIPPNIDRFTHLTTPVLGLWPIKMPNAKFVIYSLGEK